MTECERLIVEGIVTEDFFKEEAICGYTVTMTQKKVWAIELDLLREFRRVCDKYNLKWFGIYGTLLGTVRHQGFIPWDDDLDICMPRKDYDLLTKVYAKEFGDPYFLQTPYTDKDYAYSFAKLRNSKTSFATKAFIESSMNQGIFLDIYPLDESEPEGYEKRREEIVNVLKRCSSYMSRNNKYIQNKHTEFAKTQRFCDGDGEKLYETIQEIASSSAMKECEYYSLEVLTIYSAERNRWKSGLFSDVSEVPFCNTTMLVPSGWDEILKTIYGDYMKFPPIEERGNCHCVEFLDADTSYINIREKYLKGLAKEKI